MKIIGLNILLALFCLACQHSACVINGTGMLSEQEGKQLYLQVLDNETMKPRILDSALVCGGKFRMELSSVLPQTAMLSIMESRHGVPNSSWRMDKYISHSRPIIP